MAIFPVIQSPCPYKGGLTDILDDQDMCRLCHRQVHDLSAMSDRDKRAFFSSCQDDVCVSYSLPAALVTASMLAALGVAAPSASAQQAPAPVQAGPSEGLRNVIVVGGAPRLPRYVTVGPARTKISVKSYELEDLFPGRETQDCEKHEQGDAHVLHRGGKARE